MEEATRESKRREAKLISLLKNTDTIHTQNGC